MRSDSGSVLIEAAITMPLLLLVVLGIVDFGRLFQEYEVITNAAREGARVAVLPNYVKADAEKRALDYLVAGGLNTSLASATYQAATPEPIGGVGGSCITLVGMEVTYTHTYSFVRGIVQMFGSSLGQVTLTARATMRSESKLLPCP